jgi:hypothetical protein
MVEDKNQKKIIKIYNDLKLKPYKKTNLEGVDIYYEDKKYLRIHPKSLVNLTPGNILIILKKTKKWVAQIIETLKDTTLINETNQFMYVTLDQSLLDKEEKQLKFTIKQGISNNELF